MRDAAPIFIVGVGRSGTTMLRLILNRHPELAIPPESHFVQDLLALLPLREPLDKHQRDLALHTIAQHPRFRSTWHVNPEDLSAAFSDLEEPTLSELVDVTFRLEISGSGKIRWGDKTPRYASSVPELAQAFPSALFVHLVRDVRDVSRSLREKGWFGRTIHDTATYWMERVESAEASGASLGRDRFRTVRYEKLVLDTEATVRELCSFLHLEFHPSMLDFHEDAEQALAPFERKQRIHAKVVRPPSPQDVNRWMRESSRLEVYLVEAIAGSTMDRLGLHRRFRGIPRRLMPIVAGFYGFAHKVLQLSLRCYRLLPRGWRVRWQEASSMNYLRGLLKRV